MHPRIQAQPASPTPSPPLHPTVVVHGPGGATSVISERPALTSRDLAVLKARRDELSNQLQSVDSRRSKLLSQLQGVGDETARKGLEDRLSLLDQRQLQLETDIAETGRQLSSAPAGLIATTGNSDNMFRSVKSATSPILGGLFIIFVLAPLAVSMAKRILRRGVGPGSQSALSADSAQRLQRIEQSIDAIAVEIERVSEGQRFVTRLLSESQQLPAIGAARVAEPIRANQ